MARHLVARSARGIVCEPTVEALANAVRAVAGSEHDGPGHPESWLSEYSWDAAASKVGGVLGVEKKQVDDVCAAERV
jgi:hypothetical protein